MKRPDGDLGFNSPNGRQEGAALVVVLVLLVLMLGVVLAFFSQSVLQKQISKGSSSQAAADLLADGALNLVIADIQAEISDPVRSKEYDVPNTVPQVKLYYPTAFKYAVPDIAVPSLTAQNIVGKGLENLLKISTHQNGPYNSSSAPRRAADSPTSDESLNGRFISKERWNKPLLMKASDYAKPTPPAGFVTPDWIYINRKGENPATPHAWSKIGDDQVIVGRYAYVVYNEGGTLDANVAGYPRSANAAIPSSTILYPVSSKVGSIYADLTIPELGLTTDQVDRLSSWRNGKTLASNPAGSYFDLATKNNKGFLFTTNSDAQGGITDHMFSSRQQLIGFFKDNAVSPQVLQYFGTFSRSLDQPSYTRAQSNTDPALRDSVYYNSGVKKITSVEYRGETSWADTKGNSGYGQEKTINPPLSTIRVEHSGGERFDGSKFQQGEPLAKKRFPLDRLVWVTYKGPSADNMSDPIIDEYVREGVSRDYLAQGTRDHIQKCFGLNWHGSTSGAPNGYWSYDVHGTSNPIDSLDQIQGREPDFFELLKAGINVGALGKDREGIHANLGGSSNPTYNDFNIKKNTYINNQIIQIGANMIDQVAPENFPTVIVFDDRGGAFGGETSSVKTFFGVVDLPYWYGVAVASVLVTPPNPGGTASVAAVTNRGEAAALLVPIIWNSNQTPVQNYASNLTPTELRIWVTTASGYRPGRVAANMPWNFFLRDSTSILSTLNPNWQVGISVNGTLPGVLSAPAKGANHTALYFKNIYTLYRQPTPLMLPDRLGAAAQLEADSGNDLVLSKSSFSDAQQQFYTGGYPATGISESGSSDKYLGFLAGSFAVRRKGGSPSMYTTLVNLDGHPGPSRGLTYSLEYKSGSNWVPYSQISTGHTQFGGAPILNDSSSTLVGTWTSGGGPNNVQRDAHIGFDPRTARLNTNGGMQLGPILPDGTMPTLRPGTATTNWQDAFGVTPGGASKDMLISRGYFPDADGVVRRPMGGFVPQITTPAASTLTGLPMATPSGNSTKYNRPIMLRRPFRNVAEISYAFSDMPWRNLDCFSPESGFAGLLDIFCIGENSQPDSMVAGKVDLNTRQIPVLKSLLINAYRDEWNGLPSYTGQPSITDAEATALATALVTRTTDFGAGKGPLLNVADLVGRYDAMANNISPSPTSQTYSGFTQDLAATGSATDAINIIERLREAPIRALASSGQARTWNLLIDVIAQSGRFSVGSDKFRVEGERRVWMHVAIDRLTGKIIDRQIEDVVE